jgi:hypothetical protein
VLYNRGTEEESALEHLEEEQRGEFRILGGSDGSRTEDKSRLEHTREGRD